MPTLRHNSSLPDLGGLSISSPSPSTYASGQSTPSPSEEISSNYAHTGFPFPAYSSSQDQRKEPLVNSLLPVAGLPYTMGLSAALHDSMDNTHFLHTPSSGSPSSQQSFSSQQHPGSLSRRLSEPNIRSVAAQPTSHISDTRHRSPGFVGTGPLFPPETAQNRLHSPGSSSLVSIARPVVSEEEHETIPPDSSASKTYSFVSLPGNAVRKRPRRRYDEIERLYHCSWTGCTKSYGTLNHLNAHIVMERHGSKRTPTGEV
jgi:hypothetical protein